MTKTMTTGRDTGMTLREIINEIGNPDYIEIEVRCKYSIGYDMEEDDFIGMCEYKNGELISRDGDSYSLGDIYDEYEIVADQENLLTVWEYGYLEEEND